MVRFYEMMYYAIYKRRLEEGYEGYNYAFRFYTGLVFLNVTTLLLLLHAVFQRQGVQVPKEDFIAYS
ncbi:hypothetical protein TH61_02005 [Rufibacter sp. DG15C]|nr:hypothetical protein TH61_02005 [Rufibacter sp. DG15C]